MRLLFLIVLLLNVLYFGWRYYDFEGNVESLSASDPGLGKLVLLHEVQPSPTPGVNVELSKPVTGQKSAPTPEQASKTTQEPAPVTRQDLQQPGVNTVVDTSALPEEKLVCYKIGAFNERDSAQQFLEHMQSDVKEATLFEKLEERSKFWVFLPQQESLLAAKEIVDQLASKGIKDYQILTIAGKKNAISLGVYLGRKIAEQRVKQIQEMGYLPEINVVKNTISQYWLEVVTDQTDKALQDKIDAISKGIIKKIQCI